LFKKYHFGHVGGADPNLTFVLQKTAPVTTGESKERKERISKASMVTLREIISDRLFETDSRTPLRKPAFFFGDAIDEDDRILHDRDYKWLRQIRDMRFFLPNMERMYSLSHLQHMSVHRTMEWDLSRFVSDVSLSRLGAKEVYSAGHRKDDFSLFPGLVRPEYPKGETPHLGATFINQFLKVRGDFPIDFRPLGWVHSTNKSWWGRMVGFVLVELGALLQQVNYTIRLGPYTIASRRVPIIFMAS